MTSKYQTIAKRHDQRPTDRLQGHRGKDGDPQIEIFRNEGANMMIREKKKEGKTTRRMGRPQRSGVGKIGVRL